jgi:UTP:GlnB (protein PII) uridylyltransferase
LDLHRRINKLDSLGILSNLCIYVTGAYGRHKAFQYAGLDLFFIHSLSKQTGFLASRKYSSMLN